MEGTARLRGARALALLAITAVVNSGGTAGCGEDTSFATDTTGDGGDSGASSSPGAPPVDGGDGGLASPDGAPGAPGSGGGDPVNPDDPANDGDSGGADAGQGVLPNASQAGGAAHDLVIAEVALYQGVKISLMKGGETISPLNAPIVKNRAGLMRLFVKPDPGFTSREIVAELSVEGAAAREVTVRVDGASTDDDLGTTFNFDLSSDDLGQDWQYSVSLHETTSSTATDGPTDGSLWPTQGTASLEPQSSGPSLKIVFVPIQYEGDDSGRLPDTSDGQIQYLVGKMMAEYPVSRVEYSVHAPMSYSNGLNSGSGWGSALNAVCALRRNDAPAANVYYYGLVAPASSLQSYCGNGCVTGIALLSQGATDNTSRCAMGLDYTNKGSGVFLQEVAHNHGRKHAPCGNVSQVDQTFPYTDARIGVWGYDLLAKKLVDPNANVDFMSYCSPVWISDYTYGALFKRIAAVNAAATLDATADPRAIASEIGAPVGKDRIINVESDGSLSWGDEVRAARVEDEASVEVTLVDDAGKELTVAASRYPHSDGKGAMIVIPTVEPKAISAVRLPNRDFQRIAPATRLNR